MRKLLLVWVLAAGACKSYPGGAPENLVVVGEPGGGFSLLYNDVEQVACKQHIFGTDECDTKVEPRLVRIGLDGNPQNGGGDALTDRYDLDGGDVGENRLLSLDGGGHYAYHAGKAYLVGESGTVSPAPPAVASAFEWAGALFAGGTGLVGVRAQPDDDGTGTSILLRHFSLAGDVLDDPPIQLRRFSGLIGNGSFASSILAGRSSTQLLVVWHLRQEIYEGLRLSLDGTPLDPAPLELGNVDGADETAGRITATSRGFMVSVTGSTGATFVIPRTGRPAQVSDPVPDRVLALAGAGSTVFAFSVDGTSQLVATRVDADGVLIDTQVLDDLSGDLEGSSTFPVDSFDELARFSPSLVAAGDGAGAVVAYTKAGRVRYRHLSADGENDEHPLPGGGCAMSGHDANGVAVGLAMVLVLLARRRSRRAPA